MNLTLIPTVALWAMQQAAPRNSIICAEVAKRTHFFHELRSRPCEYDAESMQLTLDIGVPYVPYQRDEEPAEPELVATADVEEVRRLCIEVL